MKIYPRLIFTVLGNAVDKSQEGYLDEKNNAFIPLSNEIVNACLDTDDKLGAEEYYINIVLNRQGLVDIFAENANDDNDYINLIDGEELYKYLNSSDNEHTFETICKILYASVPEI